MTPVLKKKKVVKAKESFTMKKNEVKIDSSLTSMPLSEKEEEDFVS